MLELNKIFFTDCLEGMRKLPDNCIDLVVTSQPYAQARKNTYGGIPADKYIEWLTPRAQEIYRILKPTGSFILNIGDNTIDGETHLYTFEIPIVLKRELGFKFIDPLCWHKKTTPPGKFANRFKGAWEFCYHFTKTLDIKFFPRAVAQPTKEQTIQRYLRNKETADALSGTGSGLRNAAKAMNRRLRGTGSNFSSNDKQLAEQTRAYPSNVLHYAGETTNVGHPAAFPEDIPAFFIKAFSEEGDTVLDPFCGSGTTCLVAKKLNRNFIGYEIKQEYFKTQTKRQFKEFGLFSDLIT